MKTVYSSWPMLLFQIRLCQFHSYPHFFSQYPSSSARSKLLGSSHYSLNYQHHIHFIGYQFSNESILNWVLLSTVHSTMLALNTCHLYYILTRHRVSFALPPSISYDSSSNLVSTLLLPLVVFDMLALLFGIPPSSSQIYQL